MKKESQLVVAIIPAAGICNNKLNIHSDSPDTMLPLNGKPVIGHILDDLLSRQIHTAVIILNTRDKHTEKYISKKFASKLKLIFVRNNLHNRGLGYSIYLGCKEIKKIENQGMMVYLGDTIYKGPLRFDRDFLIVNPNLVGSNKWCYVEKNAEGLVYINKPDVYTGTGNPLIGIYYFSDGLGLIKTLDEIVKNETSIEMDQILTAYGPHFDLRPATRHYDCGNIENYYQARIDFLRTRSFNILEYNDLLGTIKKSGTNREKLADEINWFNNIPQELKIFAPRMIDYKIDEAEVSYSLEYYGYQSLADYFVLNQFDLNVWQTLIDRLFAILALFRKYHTPLPYTAFYEMYVEKTQARINILEQDENWRKLLSEEKIIINETTLNGWPYYAHQLNHLVESLHKSNVTSFIHGDLCLSNILFDPHTLLVKMIDPRGRFGTQSIYGDHRYDIAKLRHSFGGLYDFILSDLFVLNEKNNSFIYKVLCDEEHLAISKLFDATLQEKGYDLPSVALIEALLFVSMIPLHSDAPIRQKAMFLTSIQRLNELNI